MQLETFCLTQICYDIHELLFKGEDEGLPQMDCGVDSSGIYCANLVMYRLPHEKKITGLPQI